MMNMARANRLLYILALTNVFFENAAAERC